jgi:hypothetical protein
MGTGAAALVRRMPAPASVETIVAASFQPDNRDERFIGTEYAGLKFDGRVAVAPQPLQCLPDSWLAGRGVMPGLADGNGCSPRIESRLPPTERSA